MLGFFVRYDLHCFALCRDSINIAMWPWNGQQRERETGICTASQTVGWMGWPMMARHADAKKKKTKKNENMKDGSENKFYTVFFFVISCHCCGASGCTWGMPNWISHWVQMSAARIRFGMCSLSSAGRRKRRMRNWRPEILSLFAKASSTDFSRGSDPHCPDSCIFHSATFDVKIQLPPPSPSRCSSPAASVP